MQQNTNFDQFLDFLAHFSSELAFGISPEYALIRTSQYFGRQTPREILGIFDDINGGTKSFQSAWADLITSCENSNNARLLELLSHFIEKGSKIGGERMLEVVKQVRQNLAITKRRKSLVSGQKVKVIALSLVSSMVIGMIAALTPLLSFTFYSDIFSNPTINFPLSTSIQILIALLLTVIITGYRLNQTVGGSFKTILLCVIAFGSTYVLVTQLLLTLL
ncbi:MAG: hypothetical protein ACFFD8_00010 [Candidatus Thorarchaeota archaeon]